MKPLKKLIFEANASSPCICKKKKFAYVKILKYVPKYIWGLFGVHGCVKFVFDNDLLFLCILGQTFI